MRRRSGRRPGNPDTRGAILEAARRTFAERGYDGSSIRHIATSAGVDPALVHHYFGSKEDLFLEVVKPPIEPGAVMDEIFAAGIEAVPENVVRTFLGVCEGPVSGPAFLGLLRGAVAHEWQALLLREFFTTQIARRVVRRLGAVVDPAEVPLRASLVSSQLFGLAMVRYVLRIQPLAGAPEKVVIAAVAPNIRRYMVGDLSAEDDLAV
ncbi:TetR/AcrR family transcriptional regulator [Streptomyces olivochromogenes]|uniref:TetR/AcrR family transcriptional regulator n=1 Tax=Streptomyces olivochromogenes TaxID=1963 RepID=UPI001F3AA597|nr:TetR family transcriptional regulator [Streptomyces olivochromogenes]MCF3131687.1 TetR family transcriptional regulator [Streptomyces olivochromogenes]